MNIKDLDLNLLRLFDAVWRTRSVSRAAETLDLSQPAASQGLARLRALLAESQAWLGLSDEHFRGALSASLELLGAEPPSRPAAIASGSGFNATAPGRLPSR